MKKATILAMCILCLAMIVGEAAFADQVTLSELKQQVPERLQMTVEGANGLVSIDAAVILPEEDDIPIIKAYPRYLDASAVHAEYSDTMPPNEGYAWYYHYLEGRTAPLLIYPQSIESERYVPKKYGGDAGAARLYSLNEQPDNNDLSPEAPEALLRNVLALAGVSDADVRLSMQMAVSRPYEQIRIRTEDAEAPILLTANVKKPIPSPDKGYWFAGFSQYLRGARVFAEPYQATAPTKWGASPASPASFSLLVEMVSEEDYYLDAGLLEEVEVLEATPALASFESIQQAISDRIRDGKLLDVREIELGYMLFWEIPMEEMEEDEWQPGMGRYVLAPVWRVTGYDVKDRAAFKFYRQGNDPTKPDEIDYAYAKTLFGGYQVRFDARTGEYISSEDYVWEQ